MCNCTRNWSKWGVYFAYWSRKNVFPWKGLTALVFSYLFSAYTDIHSPFPNKNSNHGSSPWPCVTGDKDAWLYQGALQVNWMCVWEEEAAHISPICLYTATSLSTLLAALLWNVTDPFLVQSFLKIPLKTVPDIFEFPAWRQSRHSWLGGSYLFSNSALPLGCSPILTAVSVGSCYCTSTSLLVTLSSCQNETPAL